MEDDEPIPKERVPVAPDEVNTSSDTRYDGALASLSVTRSVIDPGDVMVIEVDERRAAPIKRQFATLAEGPVITNGLAPVAKLPIASYAA